MTSSPGTKKAPSARAVEARQKRKAGLRRARREFPASRYVIIFCQTAVLVVVGWQVYHHVLEVRKRIAAPFQFDYEEGNVLNALARIAHGLSPYPDPHAFPNILNPYGPVSYYLLAVPVKFFGLSFAGPRMVIAASVLTISICIALLLARMTGSRLTGIIFGFIYATLGLVRDWSGLLRVDFLTLALTTMGICFFSRIPELRMTECSEGEECLQSQSSVRPLFASANAWVGAVLLSAAIWTKYTSLAAPAACVVFLVIHRRTRDALQFAAMGLALCALAFVATFALTHGTIITHLFLSHPDPFSWSVYTDRLAEAAWRFAPLLALSLIAIVPQIKRKKPSLAALWLILATLTAVTAGKLGSGWNHFLEWPIALCLCAGLGWAVIANQKPVSLAAAGAVIAAGCVLLFVAVQHQKYDVIVAQRECPAAYEFIRSQPGDHILAENVGALVLGGKTVWVSNPFVLNQLVTRAGWQDPDLKDMIAARKFDLIATNLNHAARIKYSLLGVDRFSADELKALVENYHIVAKFHCTDAAYMFVPNE